MLDAYVDQQVQNPATHDDGKPVSKKNKNKKKREQREAEEKRRQSESNSQHPDDDEDEVNTCGSSLLYSQIRANDRLPVMTTILRPYFEFLQL